MNKRQRVGGGKKLARSGRHAARKTAARPHKMARTQAKKLKNAARSSGEAFADALKEYYWEKNRFDRREIS